MDGYLATIPDRQIEDALINCERILADHLEYDCGDGDGCPTCVGAGQSRRELEAEKDRRLAEDIRIEDPNEPTFEERYAPFGLAWQEEQMDRYAGVSW